MAMLCCVACEHPVTMHHAAANGAFRCQSSGCGCEVARVHVQLDRTTSVQERDNAASRLRALARHVAPGTCRIVSMGADCVCPLCDIDLLAGTAVARRLPEDQ